MPSKTDDGFYICSTTGKAIKHVDPSKLKKEIKAWKSTSNFVLCKDKYKYARVYVAYDDEGDPREYSWIIRMMELTNCKQVTDFWNSKSSN
jgi:hypothetical protein